MNKKFKNIKKTAYFSIKFYHYAIFLIFFVSLLSFFHTDVLKGGSTAGKTEISKEIITVIKIVDGDTLTVNYNGHKENIRLIGIDTPESFAGKKAKRDSKQKKKNMSEILKDGKKSAAFTASLVKPGMEIAIEFDVEKRDRYGRLLCYVFFIDGRMLNEEIIKNGYASVLTIPPNVTYQQKFIEAYKYARRNGLGLWKN